jgi:hypothetical protein
MLGLFGERSLRERESRSELFSLLLNGHLQQAIYKAAGERQPRDGHDEEIWCGWRSLVYNVRIRYGSNVNPGLDC